MAEKNRPSLFLRHYSSYALQVLDVYKRQVEVTPMSWSEFGNVHPFAPTDQVEGSLQVIKELEHDLAVITGLDGCSLQPNSGAAGE